MDTRAIGLSVASLISERISAALDQELAPLRSMVPVWFDPARQTFATPRVGELQGTGVTEMEARLDLFRKMEKQLRELRAQQREAQAEDLEHRYRQAQTTIQQLTNKLNGYALNAQRMERAYLRVKARLFRKCREVELAKRVFSSTQLADWKNLVRFENQRGEQK